MDWYFIVLICLISFILLAMILLFICYMMTFYSSHKNLTSDEIILPNQPIYQLFKDNITKDITDVRKLKYEEFSIKSFDGLTLYAKYYESIKGAPIEIMFHGYRGSGERDLSTGVKRAFLCKRNALVVDQRASGKSDGHTISFGINERHDCLNWINFVVKHFGDDVKIILTGISMGAATVLLTSSMDLPKNVVGILADCGYDNASDMIKKVIKEMKLPPALCYPLVKLGAKIFGHFNIEETSPYEAVKNSKVPIIFIHGDNDSLVPYYMSEKLYNVCSSKKKLVKISNADHGVSYLVDPDTYINELNNFFTL